MSDKDTTPDDNTDTPVHDTGTPDVNTGKPDDALESALSEGTTSGSGTAEEGTQLERSRLRVTFELRPLISVIAIVAATAMITTQVVASRQPEPVAAPVFQAADRAFGETAGDVPARVCAARGVYDPAAVARTDAVDRQNETQRPTNSLSRGSLSLEALQACLVNRMQPSLVVSDLDGDHLPEVIAIRNSGGVELFWNNGGVFQRQDLQLLTLDQPEGGRIPGDSHSIIAVADVDGDGRNDLVGMPHNGDQTLRILRNLGERRFADQLIRVAVEEHVGRPDSVTTADINRDGIADIVSTLRTSFGGENVSRTPHLVRVFLSTAGKAPFYREVTTAEIPMAHPDAIRQSVTVSVNASRPYQPFTPLVTDLDGDGNDDIFIAADAGGSRILFRDKGRWVDYTTKSAIVESGGGMGASLHDYNGDGLLDIFTTEITYDYSDCGYGRACDYTTRGNNLFINNGDRTFSNESRAYGLQRTGWGWGYASADYNNDGYDDVFIGVGQNARSRTDEDWATIYQRPYLMLGMRDQTYTDASGEVFRSWTMPGTTQAIAAADFDGDFRVDLLVVGEDNMNPYLIQNRTMTGNAALLVVRGLGAGHSPLNGEGATVTVEIPDRPVQRFQFPSRSTNYRVHGSGYPVSIGLGDADDAVVTVNYPSGTTIRQRIVAQKVNIITEPSR